MQPKVLIVEDDRFLSSMLKTNLERDGFGVEQAFEGEEGLAKLKSAKPDLVLLDLMMPKMSGFELLGHVVADPELNTIPVIVMSNIGEEGDVNRARDLGVVDYFVKAQTPLDNMGSIVREHLKKSVAPKQN